MRIKLVVAGVLISLVALVALKASLDILHLGSDLQDKSRSSCPTV